MRIAAGSIALSVGSLALLSLGGGVLRDLAPVVQFDYDTRFHLDVAQNCYRSDVEIGTDCFWAVEDSTRSVFLVGDSNAGHFSEAMLNAALGSDYDFTLAVNTGCPPLPLGVIAQGVERENCDGFVEKVLEAVARDTPEVIVLASASSIYIDDDSYQLIDPISGRKPGDAEGKALLWSQALESLLTDLEGMGSDVIVVSPIPHFFAHDGRIRKDTCPALRLLSDPWDCGVDADRDQLEARRALALDAELRATASVSSANSVDFFDVLCPGTRCSMYRQGEWLYRDGTHLSVHGALELTDEFRAMLVDG